MAELKTKPNSASVKTFIDGIADEQRRKDCRAIMKLMKEATGAPPKMWGSNIVGFGAYHYKYASGREGDWFLVGFSPRKQNLTLYIIAGFEQYAGLMKKLGKYKTGKSCLYINKLEDIHLPTLKQLVARSAKHMVKTNAPK